MLKDIACLISRLLLSDGIVFKRTTQLTAENSHASAPTMSTMLQKEIFAKPLGVLVASISQTNRKRITRFAMEA
jgi:hypothetical protein